MPKAILSRAQMEVRRLRAVELFRQGKRQCEVAVEMKVSRTTAARWYFNKNRPDELKARKATGKPPRVALGNLRAIWRGRKSWTGPEFADAVDDRIRVRYHDDSARRILRKFAAEKAKATT